MLPCCLQKEDWGGAWIHISTIKETIAKLGWPKKHLCDMDKGGALSVPLSHLHGSLYIKISVVLRIPFPKAESQSHTYSQPVGVHESRTGVMQPLHTSGERPRTCSVSLLSLAEVCALGNLGSLPGSLSSFQNN